MGRPKSFDTELVNNSQYLLGRAYNLTRNKSDAEDLVADALERAMNHWHTYIPGSNMSGWLHVIMFRIWVSKTRRQKWIKFDNDAGMEEPATTGPTDTGAIARDIARALELLSPQQVAVVKSVLAEGSFYHEAAAELGLTQGAVKACLHVARRKLKKAIEGEINWRERHAQGDIRWR